jgi:hypothetical protein
MWKFHPLAPMVVAILATLFLQLRPAAAAETAFETGKIGLKGLWVSPKVSFVEKTNFTVLSETGNEHEKTIEFQYAGNFEVIAMCYRVFRNERMHDFEHTEYVFMKPGDKHRFQTTTGEWFVYVYQARHDFLRNHGNDIPEWDAIKTQWILSEKMAREAFDLPMTKEFQKKLDDLK